MKKEKLFIVILMTLTAIGITVTGIIFKQSFFRILPLYVSLVVYLLNSRINRFGLLLGALNSVLYCTVFLYYKLYASAFSAIGFSFVFQMITFIRWNKRPYGNSTVLKRLTVKKALLFLTGFAVAWCGTVAALTALKSNNTLLDTTCSLIGLLSYSLMLLSYYEYTFVNVLSALASVALYVQMIPQHPEQTTYLVFSVYSTTCCILAVKKAIAYYKEQREKNIM